VTKSTTVGAFAVLSWHERNALPEHVRKELLGAGVAKGTASKIVSILTALDDGTISPEDVTSIANGYKAIRHAAIRKQGMALLELCDGNTSGTVLREAVLDLIAVL
jgi:hypothetical protein